MIQNTNNTNPLLVEYSESKKEQICENIGALKTDGDGSNITATFTESTTKENITTGDPLGTIFGKIAKWFSSFATVAFSGKYTDLSEVPESFVPESHATTHGSGGNDPITPESIGALDSDSDVSNTTVEFTPSQTREAIATGESLATIFGKIAKWLADLKTVAFSGKYTDLSEIPTTFAPSTHANTHALNGVDPILPSSIGAQSEITVNGILKGDGSGNITAAEAGSDYITITQLASKQNTIDVSGILKGDGNGGISSATPNTDYAIPSQAITATLLASGWADNSQTLTVSGVTATSNGLLRIAQTATAEQFTAWGAALPRITAQAADSITVTIAGTVPTVDIPVEVILL